MQVVETSGKAWSDRFEGRNGVEELRHLLVCTSVELESTRAAAIAQARAQEGKVKDLMQLLVNTQKERDEALQLCLCLRNDLDNILSAFANYNMSHHNEDGLSCITNSISIINPPSQSDLDTNWINHSSSATDCITNYNLSNCMASAPELMIPAPPPPPSLLSLEDLQMLEEGLEQNFSTPNQTSAASLAWGGAAPHDNSEFQLLSSSCSAVPPLISCIHTKFVPIMTTSISISPSSSSNSTSSSSSQSSSSSLSSSPSSSSSSSTLTSPSSNLQYLPEPPETDPEIMLKSLPKKGKLLQAVIQAGPLLQNLLLAGPLPNWKFPPPLDYYSCKDNIPTVASSFSAPLQQLPGIKPCDQSISHSQPHLPPSSSSNRLNLTWQPTP